MSQAELLELQEQEDAMRATLALLAEKKKKIEAGIYSQQREAREKAELEKAITIEITALVGSSLVVKNSEIRTDLLKLLQKTPGRVFRHGENLIPVVAWEEFNLQLLDLPHLTINWTEEAKKDFKWFFNASPWELEVLGDIRRLKATPGPGIDRWILSQIPGGGWDYIGKFYTFPINEAWRVIEILTDTEGVVYTEGSEMILITMIERRNKLNLIAKKEDTDWDKIELLDWLVYSPRERKEIPFKDALLPYQKVGIEFGYETGGRYILGDDTGLGKTWQGLGLAEILRIEHNDEFQTVVVCKASNIQNWAREIRNLTQSEPVICKSGVPQADAIKGIILERAPYILISWDTLGSAQKVEDEENAYKKWDADLDSYVMVPQVNEIFVWSSFFIAAGINCLICDESHQGKNEKTKRFKAWRELQAIPHIIPMSASPVLNRTGEWWTSLNIIDPDQFKSKERFLDKYTTYGSGARNVEQLHELLRPIFIRRRKTEVFKDLPPINRLYETCEISADGKMRCNEILDGMYTSLADFDPKGQGGESMHIMGILAQITRLKQVCASETVQYTADLATRLVDSAEENEDPKVLIFSQFKGTAAKIAQLLGSEAVCTVKRTADDFQSLTANERDALFESARNDPDVKFIVTTKAAQEGHNIEYCDWVIFNEPFWGPKEHEQCEGRAYGRASNPHHIDSYYVTADVDIIKWLTEMIADKAKVIDSVVEGVALSRDVEDSVAKALITKIRENSWKKAR